jgi:hypothetical protein
LFDPEEEVYSKVELISDKYQVKTPDELYGVSNLSGPVRSFSISVFSERARVSLRCHSFQGSAPTVFATGETDEWCTRAIETVESFLIPHRRWYRGSSDRLLLFCFGLVPWTVLVLAVLMNRRGLPLLAMFLGAWLMCTVLFPVASFAKGLLLPNAILYLPEARDFVRQHA